MERRLPAGSPRMGEQQDVAGAPSGGTKTDGRGSSAYSGDGDRLVQPMVIAHSGNRDHLQHVAL